MFAIKENFLSLYVLLCLLTVLLFYVTLYYVFRKRRLLYFAWNLPKPSVFFIIRNAGLVIRSTENLPLVLNKVITKYLPVCAFWFDTLYVVSCKPQDADTALTKCLDRGNFFFAGKSLMDGTIMLAPLPEWKRQRKIINEIFKPSIVNTFFSVMLREAKYLCNSMEENKSFDAYKEMTLLATNVGCESLAGVDPRHFTELKQAISDTERIEELLIQRSFNPLLYADFFWKISSSKREIERLEKNNMALIEKMLHHNRLTAEKLRREKNDELSLYNKRLLSYLVDTKDTNGLSHDVIMRLVRVFFPVSTETTGALISSTLFMLGITPSCQEKVFEELSSIFGNSDRDVTMDDLQCMEYLERVIKETLRLFPPIPLILREADKDTPLDSFVLPKGGRIVVSMEHLHRHPDYWTEPLKFDPDRFLPENVQNRPRGAYIPFGVGSRNCPGSKYAMIMAKTTLATILRRYRVSETVDYKKVEEINFLPRIVGRPKKGYNIILQKRN